MWFDIIKKLERITLSNKDKLIRENKQQTADVKPHGLWYSFSLGSGWLSGNIEDYGWLRSYKYILYLDTSALNILQIKNLENARDFIHAYKKHGSEIGDFNEKIDWDLVSQTFDGIEILNYKTWYKSWYNTEKRIDEFIYRIFMGWDMDSGCIWNTQNLKIIKVKPLEQRHYDKEKEYDFLR